MLNETARTFLRLERFLNSYCPDIKNVKHKLRGIDGNKNQIDFSDSEKELIRQALKKLGEDLL